MTKDRLIIRPANVSDAEGILALFNPIIGEEKDSSFETPLKIGKEIDFIYCLPERMIFHVAELEEKIVGFETIEQIIYHAHAEDHVGILGIRVDKSARRQGIGRRLFEATEIAAIAKGYEKIIGYVHTDNVGSQMFHHAMGFEIIGKHKNHVKMNGKYIDSLIFEKWLKH